MAESWEKTTAEAIVADLYMHQGLGGEAQFTSPEYRRRLVVQIAGILDERAKTEVVDQTARAETVERELNLATNALHNAGEGYTAKGQSVRLHHGIQHLSRRVHTAEQRLAEMEREILPCGRATAGE